jgi:hypothetical protein
MKNVKIFVICFLVLFLALGIMTPTLGAAEEFKITSPDIDQYKKMLDDPRPYLKELTYKKILPPDLYAKLTFDVEEMKKLWAECVGFKAPDEVGKIAPEIKPGTYSYKDKDKSPGLKELMIPLHYEEFFKPGGPPLAGCYPEIKVVPTRQYHWSLPIAKATKEGMGRSQLDDKGLIKEETYVAGFPFPKPEGNFKANQIIYNFLKRYAGWESQYMAGITKGFTRSLKVDQIGASDGYLMRFKGRVLMEPHGWYDERAKNMGEEIGFNVFYLAPRDMYGNVVTNMKYLDPDKYDQMLLYINALRRVRMMSTTDIQDSIGGADIIYADSFGYSQKLSSTIFPYKCEVIAEREFLVPFATWDGSPYMSSKGAELHNYEWERRPMYVVKMTQLDKNFVYSHRILYIDKESFMLPTILNYDQKGRLYRSITITQSYFPEMGMLGYGGDFMYYDHLDNHSSFSRIFMTPTPWVGRKDLSLRGLVVKGK